jgi:hypothetical protein
MTKNISFGLFLLCTGCNPYLSKKINRISKDDQREAIYVAYPIVETRRQTTIDSFYKDPDKEDLLTGVIMLATGQNHKQYY